MNRNTIAAQLFTLRDYLKSPDQIFETLRRVKEIGYEAVQVSGLGLIEPLQLKKMVDGIGLKICATHISYERLINDVDALIGEHKLWDCEYICLGGMPEQFRSGKAGYLEFLKNINKSTQKISESGLKFVYHNHKFEFEKYDGITGLEFLLKNTDPEVFSFEIDTYWVQAGGANPVDWIRKVEGRMGIVHFKDMAIKEDQQDYAEIGEGNLDWVSIIKACRDTGVKWYAVEQDVCRNNPFDSLGMSLRYLEKFL